MRAQAGRIDSGNPQAFRKPIDYYATPRTAAGLERLAALAPTTLACVRGSAWRGDGGALLGALADAIEGSRPAVGSPPVGGGVAARPGRARRGALPWPVGRRRAESR